MRTNNCFRRKGLYAGREFLDYGIKRGEKVLDIGGGCSPFYLATHILDVSSEEYDAQRYNKGVRVMQAQELIEGTTDRLVEFGDNEFDFIYCSHILEHVENLPEALQEINRVGKRGFVAVPHCLYDFWGAPASSGHKWFCDYDYADNIFLIKKREPREFVDLIAHHWGDVMWGDKGERNKMWRMMFEGHNCGGIRMFWEIRFFWEDRIYYRVDDTILPQLDLFKEMMREVDDGC